MTLLPANSFIDVMAWGFNNPMLLIARNTRCELKLKRDLN